MFFSSNRLRSYTDAVHSRWAPSSYLARRHRKPLLHPHNLIHRPSIVSVSAIRQVTRLLSSLMMLPNLFMRVFVSVRLSEMLSLTFNVMTFHFVHESLSVFNVSCPLLVSHLFSPFRYCQISEEPSLAHLNPSTLYEGFNLYARTLGHLSSVYCLTYDRTGRYIITGTSSVSQFSFQALFVSCHKL